VYWLVGDGELAERARPPAHDHHDVTAPDVYPLPSHEAEAGEDQHVVLAVGRAEHLDVLAQGPGGRDPHDVSADLLGPQHGLVWESRTRTRQQAAPAVGDRSPQPSAEDRNGRLHRLACRTHHPDANLDTGEWLAGYFSMPGHAALDHAPRPGKSGDTIGTCLTTLPQRPTSIPGSPACPSP
jgi:hypothetical protein